MVAKVNSGKNILGILNYNENKVKQGVAKCIHENLFGREVDKLTFNAKLKGLENFMNRNRRATTKAVHISLNFHPGEKLNQPLLREIASTYMEKIGFGDQPYLVYQHFDAAHPHIHIVSTNIKSDGKRIVLYNIGKNQSEKARKEIETDFNLVKASGRKQDQNELMKPADVRKVIYGKTETKRSISNIVRSVVRSYKYTSLPELNAVLGQYNIVADRGNEGSQMQAKKGLLYRMVDDKGKKAGVPIKASSIYGKPTLTYLEKQFKLNEALRQPHKERLKQCIDLALKKSSNLFPSRGCRWEVTFQQFLAEQSIYVLFRQNEEGRVYGITFVDNKMKVVFNGSDLGKAYSAKTITETLRANEGLPAKALAKVGLPADLSVRNEVKAEDSLHKDNLKTQSDLGINQPITDLMKAEAIDHLSPDAAMRRRRKKRKRKGKSL